jgi:hypothetical protein
MYGPQELVDDLFKVMMFGQTKQKRKRDEDWDYAFHKKQVKLDESDFINF